MAQVAGELFPEEMNLGLAVGRVTGPTRVSLSEGVNEAQPVSWAIVSQYLKPSLAYARSTGSFGFA
jgi:hypothetical protein